MPIKKFTAFVAFCCCILLVATSSQSSAQSISGSSSATVGVAGEYSFFDDTFLTSPSWSIDGSASTWQSGYTYYANITWSTEGTKTVAFYDGETLKASMEVYVSPCTAPNPSSSFTYASSTTGVVITRSSNPPSGYTWFWQTTSNGTSTSSYGTTYTGTTGNVYYLRARDNTYSCWSASTLATATLPGAPSLTNGLTCGPGPVTVTMSASAGSNATTVRWYAASSGGSVLATATSYAPSLSATTIYYACSYHATHGAEGQRYAVTGTVQARPNAVASGQAICSGTATSIGITTSNGVTPAATYSWTVTQSNVTGASTGSGSTIAQTLTASAAEGTATYAVTPSSNGCAGTAINVIATVTKTPVITTTGPNPMVYGATTQLSTTSAYSYQWKNAVGDISGATSSSYSLPGPSTYKVNIKSSAGSAWCLSAPLVATSSLASQGASVDMMSTTTIFKEGVTTATSLYTLQANELAQVNQYADGLGRVIQTVATGAAPNQGDLVSHNGYGKDGFQDSTFLPYASSSPSGAIHRFAIRNSTGSYTQSDQYLFYQGTAKVATDNRPFALTKFRNTPDARVTEQGAPGRAWHPDSAHTVRNQITVNTASYPVRLWKSDGTTAGNYTAKTIIVAIVTDENGNKVRTYTNKLGQTVLKQVQLDESIGGSTVNWLDTYYVYDNFGRLKWQVPPKAVAILDASPSLDGDANLAELIYKYTYDDKGRLVEKKEPGAVAKYIVYDLFDRVVLTQDGTMQSMGRWAFVKYDLYGRTVYTGLYKNSRSRTSVQKWVEKAYTASSSSYPESNYVEDKLSGLDSLHGYSNVSFPKDSILRLAVSYYDNYDFNATGTPPFTYDNAHLSGIPTAASASVRGMATGSKRRLLSATGNVTANWIKGAVFYDSYDRVIQTQSNNHLDLNSVDKQSVLYNTIRRVEKTKSSHTAASVTTHITQYSDYDHAGRVLKTYHQINSNTPVVVAAYEYNALGQLVDKKLHNTTGNNYLQSVDYRYNIRGWLTSINNDKLTSDSGTTNDETNDYFGLEMVYNKPDSTGNALFYNGNISAIKWKNVGKSGYANRRSYKYGYDKSDKLEAATFKAHTGSGWTKEANTLDETMAYDHNGNMLSLVRKRNARTLGGANVASSVDNLSYVYTANTNVLASVEDTDTAGGFKNLQTNSAEYAHNNDGSVTRDDNKGIYSITYNMLGKPQVVTYTGGKKVEYVYDAAGIKLSTKIWQNTTLLSCTNYSGGFVYEGATPAISFFSSPEGRVVKSGSNYEYQYAIADHQGNTRVLFTSATSSPIVSFEDMEDTITPFNNLTNRVNFELYDHTDFDSSLYSYSQKLTGATNQQVGVAKSMKVYPGDKVSIKAFAKYIASSGSSNLNGFATALLEAFGYSSPPGGGETGSARAGLNNWGGLVAGGGGNGNGTYPKAFVNLLVFDKQYNLVDMAWDQINGGEQIGGTPKVAHDSLQQEYVVREEGYVYAFVSNENATLVEVYFDDVFVTYTPSRLIQGSEYYPYGMQTANSWTRENNIGNNFLYNGGTELSSSLGVYDLLHRQYDPILGRMLQADPMASKYASTSPYNFGLNTPSVLNDPLGADVVTIEIDWGSVPEDGGLTILNRGAQNGDAMWTGSRWVHRDFTTAFPGGLWIGFGNGNSLRYVDGRIYDSQGNVYTKGPGVKQKNNGSIKYTGYLGQVVRALETMKSTEYGNALISELQDSPFKFTIADFNFDASRFKNHFEPGLHNSTMNNAVIHDILTYDKIYVPGQAISDAGSGGTIYWSSRQSLENARGVKSDIRNAISLGHELFHAFDSNFGVLSRWDQNGSFGDLERGEYRASHFENYLRSEFKVPFRESYSGRALLKNGIPIYKPPVIYATPFEVQIKGK